MTEPVAEARSRIIRWEPESIDVGMDEAGTGASIVLLPALSSISTRGEMKPLLDNLAEDFKVTSIDWPGFGDLPRPRIDWTPDKLSAFLDWFLQQLPAPHTVVAAGHAAAYALRQAAEKPGMIERLVLIAPTWRGPLPTMMGGQRHWFPWVRAAIDNSVSGPPLYRLNVSRPIIKLMAREHVYSAPAWLSNQRLATKLAVTRAPGARHASARFVTGALDRFSSRETFLDQARRVTMPILVVYGKETPRKSRAEIDALIELSNVKDVLFPNGKLAVHEEYPAETAQSIRSFIKLPSA